MLEDVRQEFWKMPEYWHDSLLTVTLSDQIDLRTATQKFGPRLFTPGRVTIEVIRGAVTTIYNENVQRFGNY